MSTRHKMKMLSISTLFTYADDIVITGNMRQYEVAITYDLIKK